MAGRERILLDRVYNELSANPSAIEANDLIYRFIDQTSDKATQVRLTPAKIGQLKLAPGGTAARVSRA